MNDVTTVFPVPQTANQDASAAVDQALARFTSAAESAAARQLEMSVAAAEYVNARMALAEGIRREACTATLQQQWQLHAPRVIRLSDVARLLALSGTWAIFARPDQPIGSVPLGILREFAPLTKRNRASRREEWYVKPALAEQARALWQRVTMPAPGEARLTARDVRGIVQTIRGRRSPSKPKVKPVGEPHESLADLASTMGASDFATVLASGLVDHRAPDDVFLSLLHALKDSADLSRPMTRALDAALLVLTRARQGEPVMA